MKFTYLLLVHKNPLQLKRLIVALDNEDSTFIIHIDSKISIWPFVKQLNIPVKGRLLFTPIRIHVGSGRFSVVEATMSLIDYFFKLEIKADYVHLLSGQDYPIKPTYQISNYFEKNAGKNYIHYNSYEDEKNSDLPEGFQLYRGSPWWSLQYDCLSYIYDMYINKDGLFRFFENCLKPEEMIFQTILMNSRFKNTLVNKNLRFIKGDKGHSKPLSFHDLNEIYSHANLFTGQLSLSNDKELDKIDSLLHNTNSKKSSIKQKKYCIISAVGKDSTHRAWLNNKSQNYDVHLVVYDDSYETFKNDSKYISEGKGYKLKIVYDYLNKNPWIIDHYDYCFIPDDDILMDHNSVSKLFTLMQEYSLDIAQPALVDSYYTFKHTLKVENSVIRFTNFVEMMLPCFSKEALKKVLFTFNENRCGWGADHHWGKIVDYEKHNMAIIDDVEAIHTRPIQSRNQRNIEELNNYVQKYNLDFNVFQYV